MKGFANFIFATLIASIIISTFTNSILFFPWYLNLVYETFNLSVRASNDNCVTTVVKDDIIANLQAKPIYSNQTVRKLINVTGPSEYIKRGVPFEVGIEACFPFQIKLGGFQMNQSIQVPFKLTTVGIKYDKTKE